MLEYRLDRRCFNVVCLLELQRFDVESTLFKHCVPAGTFLSHFHKQAKIYDQLRNALILAFIVVKEGNTNGLCSLLHTV